MKFVPRSQWGARPPRASSGSIPMGRVTIHWEGPHMGTFSHDRCASKVRGIQSFHMDGRGWNDIAYTAVVCPHGYVYEGRGRGRRTAANGTDAGNNAWHAVCYLGGQQDPFTGEAQQGIRDAVAWLGGTQVNGHRDHKSTECPGNTIYSWVHSGAALGGSSPISTGDDEEMLSKDAQEWLTQEFSNQDDRIVARVVNELMGTPAEPKGLAAMVERNKRKLNRLLEHFGLPSSRS